MSQIKNRRELLGVVFPTGITVSESDPEILNNSPRKCSLQFGPKQSGESEIRIRVRAALAHVGFNSWY